MEGVTAKSGAPFLFYGKTLQGSCCAELSSRRWNKPGSHPTDLEAPCCRWASVRARRGIWCTSRLSRCFNAFSTVFRRSPGILSGKQPKSGWYIRFL